MSWGPKQSIVEGFNKFVIKNPEGCWGWSGCAPKNPGYGQFGAGMKRYRAHRASWMIHFGEIPKGMFVCHKCDNPICSNPEHLFLGTCKQNNIDMLNKNRTPILGKKGSVNPNAKFTDEDILNVKKLLATGMSQSKISCILNISQSHISNINIGNRRGDGFHEQDRKIRSPKFTTEDILNVKNLLESGMKQRDVALKLNMSQAYVSLINLGKRRGVA